MAPVIRYEKDIAGINGLMNSAGMVALMLARATAGEAFAVSIAPRATGHYAASFTVEAHPHGGEHGDRAEAILANTAAYAVDVEFHNQPGRVLGRTVDFIESE